MKKRCIALTAMLFANSMVGMDGMRALKSCRWLNVVSVTSTNLTLAFDTMDDRVRVMVVNDDSYRNFYEASSTNSWAKPWRVMENGEALVLAPDQETRFWVHDRSNQRGACALCGA